MGTQQAEGLREWALPASHLLQDIFPVHRVQMRPFDKDQIPSLLGNRLTSHSRKVIYRNSECLMEVPLSGICAEEPQWSKSHLWWEGGVGRKASTCLT